MKFVTVIATLLLASLAQAQVPTGAMISPNLVNSGNSQGSGWSGTTNYTGTGGGYSGGNTPGYNSQTNTIYFGYTQSVAAYTYAFSQALQNSGMTILGYNYSWQYLNQNPYNGNLSAKVNFAGVDGTSLHLKTWTLGATTDWTTVSGTETFANNGMAVSSIANFSLSFSGKDARYWAGYYGPQVKNPNLSLNYTFDACSSNPLSSPTCPGYAQALLQQQCTANPLTSPTCPGYAQALQIQQCSANPLSDPTCPGYANAYLTMQCNANPLYSTTCPGYETAYFNQQCSVNPLYNTRCSGYATAFKTQQCNANPLYATDCPGYAAAFKNQQCIATPLYATDCPGYAQAYLDSQCIKDSLFSKDCKGYATAYAIKYLVPLDSAVTSAVNSSLSDTAAVKANDPTTVKVATNTVSTTVNTDGSVSVGVSKTGDTNVDKAIAPPPPSANPNASPAAVVQLAPPPPGPSAQGPQERKDDSQKSTGGSPPPQNIGAAQAPSDKPAAPTARQELQARREEAAKKDAVEKGKNLANEMGKAADMESQKQIQNVVIQAMGFTPGFDAYGKSVVPDVVGYKPFTVYNNQKNIDNRANLRMWTGTDRLHNEMVDSQYNKGN